MRMHAIGLAILLGLFACQSTDPESTDPGSAVSRPHHERKRIHAPLRDSPPHSPRDISSYVARLENPKRVEALQVERVLEELTLPGFATVADIGSGPGVFALPLAHSLPHGLVYAVDIEPQQLDALRERAEEAGLRNIVPVLASMDDPHLPPGRIDLVLVIDTYHHIEDRAAYFERVRGALVPGGRLAIVEWKAGELPMGPPPERKLAPGLRPRELGEAGYQLVEQHDFHAFHDFEVWDPVD